MMKDLLRKTYEAFLTVNRTNSHQTSEHLLISDFGCSSVTTEPGSLFPHFRIFTPVKPAKGRKLNTQYLDSGHQFNPYKDTLMDYPTIVRFKLTHSESAPWQNYNRLVSVHVSRCPLNCWHCYLEECLRANCSSCFIVDHCSHDLRSKYGIKEAWFTPTDIVDTFLRQRDNDPEQKSNILRITGGEPFLVPDLLLGILAQFKSRELHNEVFLWTETNLLPLAPQPEGRQIVTDEHLQELSKYSNFCVHPCFHGLSEASFQSVTAQPLHSFELLLGALHRLLRFGIDVYPTFGSNTFSSAEVQNLYHRISDLNPSLPLRFCLIEYDLNYSPVSWRRENIPGFAHDHEMVFDRFHNIEIWDTLLAKFTGHHYSEVPRQLVAL